eukprot:Rmarinus@m.21706
MVQLMSALKFNHGTSRQQAFGFTLAFLGLTLFICGLIVGMIGQFTEPVYDEDDGESYDKEQGNLRRCREAGPILNAVGFALGVLGWINVRRGHSRGVRLQEPRRCPQFMLETCFVGRCPNQACDTRVPVNAKFCPGCGMEIIHETETGVTPPNQRIPLAEPPDITELRLVLGKLGWDFQKRDAIMEYVRLGSPSMSCATWKSLLDGFFSLPSVRREIVTIAYDSIEDTGVFEETFKPLFSDAEWQMIREDIAELWKTKIASPV